MDSLVDASVLAFVLAASLVATLNDSTVLAA